MSGKSIRFDEIDSGGTKTKTWLGYIRFIVSFYKQLDLPDKSVFYWEFLSNEDTINQIIKTVLHSYRIKDGNALAAKLSPFRSLVFRLTGADTVDALTTWGETIIHVRKHYETIVAEYGTKVIDKVKPIRSIVKGPGNWTNAYKQLHDVSINKSLDNRVRVLATIYKYGYVFRMSMIFRTYIHLGDDESRSTFNHLDLENQSWSIVEDNVQKIEFPIPVRMTRELQALTMGGPFNRGWLLPQRRGIPYAIEASISSFSSWTKLGLSNYRNYRRMYNSWLKENSTEDDYKLFQGILDQHINFDIIRYMPPVPDTGTDTGVDTDTDPDAQLQSRDIVSRSGLDVDGSDSEPEWDYEEPHQSMR